MLWLTRLFRVNGPCVQLRLCLIKARLAKLWDDETNCLLRLVFGNSVLSDMTGTWLQSLLNWKGICKEGCSLVHGVGQQRSLGHAPSPLLRLQPPFALSLDDSHSPLAFLSPRPSNLSICDSCSFSFSSMCLWRALPWVSTLCCSELI